MKKVWYQHKKLILGTVSIVLVLSVIVSQVLHNYNDAKAAMPLLTDMNKFLKLHTSGINIVEIVPEVSVSYEEMGLFVGTIGSDGKDVTSDKISGSSFSKYFTQTFQGIDASTYKQLDTYLQMRMYGLIPASGPENNVTGELTNYPIVSTRNQLTHPVFRISESADGNGEDYAVPQKYMFDKGNYAYDGEAGTRKLYKLAEGYVIEDGIIYKSAGAEGTTDKDRVEPDDKDDNSVSDNSVSDNSVSDNEVDRETVSENSYHQTVAVDVDDDTAVIDLGDDTDDDSDVNSDEVQTSDDGEAERFSYEQGAVFNNFDISIDAAAGEPIVPDWSAKYYTSSRASAGSDEYLPLPEGITYVGESEDANVCFIPDEKGNYWGYSANPYRAHNGSNAKYINANWFRSAVLGGRYKNIPITINQVAASELDTAANKALLESAHLVYISGTAEAFAAKGNISKEAATALYNATVSAERHLGIIIDYDAYNPETSTMLDKLCWMLWQKDQQAVAQDEDYSAYFNETTGTIKEDSIDQVFENDGLLQDMHATMLSTYEGNLVTGNVYVYDHYMHLFDKSKALVDCHDFFGNGDFASQYTQTTCVNAFNDVVAAVKNHNIYNPNDYIPEKLTPAVIIQYIMSAKHFATNLIKSQINVLEIEPCASFLYNKNNFTSDEFDYSSTEIKENRNKFISDYIDERWVTEEKQNYVSFTSMTVAEFNTKNESLFENYDIVYIGSETGAKVTKKKDGKLEYKDNIFYVQEGTSHDLDTKKDYKNVITDFKDNAMDGMVYYNLGDEATVGNRSDFSKILSDENGKTIKTRYMGNDLTTDKMRQLETYIQNGHPIIVAADLMRSTESGIKTINPTAHVAACGSIAKEDYGRIDNSSNMYELFQFALGNQFDYETREYVSANGIAGTSIASTGGSSNNFISAYDVEQGWVTRENIAEYLNAPQLYLDIAKQPEEYSYELVNDVIDEETINYLTKDDDEKTYHLDYEFVVSGVSTSEVEHSYAVRLFVDVNADGKFSADEECNDAVITEADSGEEVVKSENGKELSYELKEGITYHLTREIPEGYVGVIPWCLRVEQFGDSYIQASSTGFTCVPGDKKVIKILQLVHDGNLNVVDYDLERSMKNAASGFSKYLQNVPDYDVYIKTVKVTQYCTDYRTYQMSAAHKNEVSKYGAMAYFETMEFKDVNGAVPAGRTVDEMTGVDMLVLGFGDDYKGMSNLEGVDGLKAFIKEGNPVLLTHDFMMFYDNNNSKDPELRNLLGMDRYGVKSGITQLTQAAPDAVGGTNGGHGSFAWDADSTDKDKDGNTLSVAEAIEGHGKAVAYIPGSNREKFSASTQGYTYGQILRYKTAPTDKHYLKAIPSFNWGGNAAIEMYVDQENEGQLTEYPYHIPRSFPVSSTHMQYFALDQERDQDLDGSPDMVVWYTMNYKKGKSRGVDGSTSIYTASPGNGADNYYIYNMGNITYTGAGHSKISSANEQKLFVNTLLAAYRAAETAPIVKFYETGDITKDPIGTVAIPYDSNVTKPVKEDGTAYQSDVVDSSIQYNSDKQDYDYKFVDPNTDSTVAEKDKTPVFFKISDIDFKKGEKRISIKFYAEMLEWKDAAGNEMLPGYQLDNKGNVTYETKTTTDVNNNTVETVDSRNEANIGYYDRKKPDDYVAGTADTWTKNDATANYNGVGNTSSIPQVAKGAKDADGKDRIKEITVSGAKHYVQEIPIQVYRVNKEKLADGTYKYTIGDKLDCTFEELDQNGYTVTASQVMNGETYACYLPLAYLNGNGSFNIYLEAQTYISNISSGVASKVEIKETKGYGNLGITKVDLLKLD